MEIALNMEALAKSNCAALLFFPSHPLSHILTPHFFLKQTRLNSVMELKISNRNELQRQAKTFLSRPRSSGFSLAKSHLFKFSEFP
jgi:hypothetical protein